MTLLTEEERSKAISLYNMGYSFQEVTQRILQGRSTAVFMDMVKEVKMVVGVTGEYIIKQRITCECLKEIGRKRDANIQE